MQVGYVMDMLEHLKGLSDPNLIQTNMPYPDLDNDWTLSVKLNEECIRLDNVQKDHQALRTVWTHIVGNALTFDRLYFEDYFMRTPEDQWPGVDAEEPNIRPSIELLVNSRRKEPTLEFLEKTRVLNHMALPQVAAV